MGSDNQMGLSWESRDDELAEPARQALIDIVGSENVLTARADRYAYSRDRLPYGIFRLRAGKLPGTLPAAIVCPANVQELAAVVELANRERIALIPFGAGSGVLGGTIPLNCEVIVDLKRMNQVLKIDRDNHVVTVQAGMNGWQFEELLREQGYTAGHLPQSIKMSTVGGWAACRGAGQASTRYGKIEDIVVGLRAVLPNGRELCIRPVARRAVGPSIKDLLVGSEGVFGFITELTLRIWKLPEYESAVVLAFPSHEAGLQALKQIVQSELRPVVTRLYDEQETCQRTEGLAEFGKKSALCILHFSGLKALATVEQSLALEICHAHGGVESSLRPNSEWEQNRYKSYSVKWQRDGYYMDTIEIVAPWSELPALYDEVGEAVRALHADFYFAAHWSHVYPEGACQYMTIRLPPMEDELALKLHRTAWDRVERLCLKHGGSIAHHHGVGVFRNQWLREELDAGMDLLQAVKDGVDPLNLLNPGKVGLRPATGAMTIYP